MFRNLRKTSEPLFDLDKAVFNLEEAAAFLGISTRTARERAAKGLLPGTKIGQGWRFRRDALLQLLPSDSLDSVSSEKSSGSTLESTREEEEL